MLICIFWSYFVDWVKCINVFLIYSSINNSGLEDKLKIDVSSNPTYKLKLLKKKISLIITSYELKLNYTSVQKINENYTFLGNYTDFLHALYLIVQFLTNFVFETILLT